MNSPPGATITTSLACCLPRLKNTSKTYSTTRRCNCGQTRLSEIDALISYYRAVQAEKAKMDKMGEDMKKAGRTILAMMQHFEIRPGTVLTGEIPGEIAYEVWAGEQGKIPIRKTEDLANKPDNANIMVIKFSGY